MTKVADAKVWLELRKILPVDSIITDPVELIAYEIDGSLGHGQPIGVVLPRDVEEVKAIVKWAKRNQIPLVARGAGTGLSGGAVALNNELIVSFARMKRVLELNEDGRFAVVQPGVVHLTFDELTRGKGLYYPPDPASGRACTLGGTLAENAGGPHCFKYGVTTNYVLGLEVVLSDGTVIHTGGTAYDYPEYDLTGIIVGSEGTLGLITSANLRLIRRVPDVMAMMAIFNSVEQAGEAVSNVIARGLTPATLEMMDRNMIGIVENYIKAGLPVDADALLIIEVDGYPESLKPQMDEITSVVKEFGAREILIANSEEEREKIWYGRKSAFGAIAQISLAYLIVDGTVPRSKLALALSQINHICNDADVRVGYVFHAGDGNLHPLLLFDPNDVGMVERVHQVGHQVMELCVQLGGTITGEHGVGSEKRQYMDLMFTPAEMQAMKEIKEIFDQENIFNPGKLLPEFKYTPPSVTSNYLDDVLAPRSTDEASQNILTWFNEQEPRALRIRGSGTKSSMLPPSEITLYTKNLQGIKELSLNDLYVRVASGTKISDLQEELASKKVFVPIASPWPESTIGGIIATNFNAPLRSRYGAIRDLILSMTVVLPDGRIIRAGRDVVKNVAGYDLAKMFVGSHGTLGLITEASFRIVPFPRARRTVIVSVADINKAIELSRKLLKVCFVASSLLLCQNCEIDKSNPFSVIYTAEGLSEDVQAEMRQVVSIIEGSGVRDFNYYEGTSGTEVWAGWLRNAFNGTVVRMGVAPNHLGKIVTELGQRIKSRSFIADAQTGMTYVQSDDVDMLYALVNSLGGYLVIISGQFDTVDRWRYHPEGLALMRKLKSKWDPRNLFNPGAFLL